MTNIDLRNNGSSQFDKTEPIDPDKSLGELIGQLGSDLGSLVSTQMELAKVEIKEEVVRAGRGAGMAGGGVFAAYLAILFVSLAAAWGLSEAMPTGWAFFIVGVIYAIAAAVLLAMGRDRLREVRGPVVTTETVKEDVQWARQQMS